MPNGPLLRPVPRAAARLFKTLATLIPQLRRELPLRRELTGLLSTPAEAIIEGSGVFVNVADELSLLAVLVKPGHPDQVGALENVLRT